MDSQKVETSAPPGGGVAQQNPTDRGVVAGLFIHRLPATQALQDLRAAGFTSRHIGVTIRDHAEPKMVEEKTETRTAEGATTGALGGGLLGGLAGLLVGVGALTLLGIGPVIAGGALASALGTAIVGAGIGAAAGGLLGALVGMGIPEAEVPYFAAGIHSGQTLVIVEAGGRASEARKILERHGADTGVNSEGLTPTCKGGGP